MIEVLVYRVVWEDKDGFGGAWDFLTREGVDTFLSCNKDIREDKNTRVLIYKIEVDPSEEEPNKIQTVKAFLK